jgi:cytochrome P450
MKNPRDDITTQIATAEVDGDSLTPEEFGSFFVLLVVAGNETTRNAISHGMLALTDNPEQKKLWIEDFKGLAPTAVEEIIRWSTPVIHFRRTCATANTEVGGQTIREGEKVALWYNSANRDEAVFDDPQAFDVRRSPNPHVSFGIGTHFCLGAHLARLEARVFVEELLAAFAAIEPAGEPARVRSNLANAYKRLPVRLVA